MEFWVITLVTLISSVLASTGLWALIQKSVEKKDAKSKMILGLGHDRIMCLGMKYLNRGWITQEEYENLYKYLYKPYTELGGNGTAKHMMERIDRLPIKDSTYEVKEVDRKPVHTALMDEDDD